jgi:adenine-specific DNA-methyltransferase
MMASLWAYFLVHSLAFLSPGGRLAFVLPSAALSSDYAQPILGRLRQSFARLAIFSVSERVFLQAGAEVRAVVLLADDFDPREASGNADVRIRTVSTVQDLANQVGSFALAPEESLDDEEVDGLNGLDILERIGHSGNLCTFGDQVDVKIGEVVGDTDFFVKTASEWAELGLDDNITPLITKLRQFAGIQLMTSDWTSAKSLIPSLLIVPPARVSKTLTDYLDTYPEKIRKTNCTFAKRTPWYAVSYDTSAKAFVGSIAHEGPRVVINSAGISCGNGLYKLSPRQGVKWNPAISVACLSTVTQLSAELKARVRGAGAMKLEPSGVRRLLLPNSYLTINTAGRNELISAVDRHLRSGNRDKATDLVDQAFLVATEILKPNDLAVLRESLRILRANRRGH